MSEFDYCVEEATLCDEHSQKWGLTLDHIMEIDCQDCLGFDSCPVIHSEEDEE